MTKKTVILALLFLVSYHFVLKTNTGTSWSVSQHQWQDNMIKEEKFLFTAEYKDGIHDGTYYIEEKRQIKTRSLGSILDEYLLKGTSIDFLTIDAEGLDLQVLKSNNWDKYQPQYVLVEELGTTLMEIINNSEVFAFLSEQNYKLMHRTLNTSFYKHQD